MKCGLMNSWVIDSYSTIWIDTIGHLSVFSLGQCPLPAPNSSFLELSNESDEGLVVSPLDDFMSCIHHPTVVASVTPLRESKKCNIVPQRKNENG